MCRPGRLGLPCFKSANAVPRKVAKNTDTRQEGLTKEAHRRCFPGESLVSASRNMLRCIRYRQISWSSFQSNRCRCLKPDNSVYFAPRSTAWAVEPRNRPPSRSSNTSQSQSKPMRLFSLSGIQGSVRAWVRAWAHGWGHGAQSTYLDTHD